MCGFLFPNERRARAGVEQIWKARKVKTESAIIWSGLAAGLLFCAVNGALACLFLGEADLRNLLRSEVLSYGLYAGLAAQLLFAGFGVAVSRIMARRRQAEEQVRESEARYRTLVEQIPAVIYVAAMDEARTMIFISRHIEQLTDFRPDEFKADPNMWRKQLHPDDRERVLARLKRCCETGEPYACEYRMLGRDERVVWVRDEGKVFEDGVSPTPRLQGVMLDVTERRRHEKELREVERLRSLRELAVGVAHNYNNLLSGITAYAALVSGQLEKRRSPLTPVEKLLECVDRAAQLTDELLASTRASSSERHPVRLDALVEDLAQVCKASFGRDIKLAVDVAAPAAVVMASRADLHAALFNICENAREAMPNGGTLHISANAANGQVAGAENEFVVMEISDTGVGIDPEVRRKVFDPFFSTKNTVGVGLSLSVTRRTIEEHGGSIEVEGRPGGGTTFRLLLPAALQGEEQELLSRHFQG